MPYITRERRNRILLHPIDGVAGKVIAVNNILTPGELNYAITMLVNEYLKWKIASGEGNYTTLNEIVGAMDCAKAEFYRRVVVPAENRKMFDNGDVYDV